MTWKGPVVPTNEKYSLGISFSSVTLMEVNIRLY
jgi:hypothetical protein